jgi:uncharacterized protein YbcI
MAVQSDLAAAGSSQAARISAVLVHLLAKYAGRGPTVARTTIGRDHVLVVLRDTLTKAERTLKDAGNTEVVIEGRQGLQGALKNEAIEAVEAVMGREVIAFMSTNHLEPDIAAELFVLAGDGNGSNGPPLQEGEAEG